MKKCEDLEDQINCSTLHLVLSPPPTYQWDLILFLFYWQSQEQEVSHPFFLTEFICKSNLFSKYFLPCNLKRTPYESWKSEWNHWTREVLFHGSCKYSYYISISCQEPKQRFVLLFKFPLVPSNFKGLLDRMRYLFIQFNIFISHLISSDSRQ